LKTVNAGQTWQLTNLQTPDEERPTGMFFLNNTTGFISGKLLFRKTVDGGQSWSEVMDPISENINDVSFKVPMKDMLLLIMGNILNLLMEVKHGNQCSQIQATI